jgi:NAD(P)H-dependent flavin oxidoreductase YrpB (nitropropane dioxygenase family)
MAGQSAGLVDDVIPVEALIERTVWEAEAIIRQNAAQIRPSAITAQS